MAKGLIFVHDDFQTQNLCTRSSNYFFTSKAPLNALGRNNVKTTSYSYANTFQPPKLKVLIVVISVPWRIEDASSRSLVKTSNRKQAFFSYSQKSHTHSALPRCCNVLLYQKYGLKALDLTFILSFTMLTNITNTFLFNRWGHAWRVGAKVLLQLEAVLAIAEEAAEAVWPQFTYVGVVAAPKVATKTGIETGL